MNLKTAKGVVDNALAFVLVVLFLTLVLDVLWQVVSRYALGAPSAFTDEVARFSFMWLVMLGAGYTAGQEGHLAVDVLHQSVGPGTQRFLSQLVFLVSLSFGLAVLFGGSVLVHTSWALGQRTPVLGLPLGLIYLVVPALGALLTFYRLVGTAKRATGQRAEKMVSK